MHNFTGTFFAKFCNGIALPYLCLHVIYQTVWISSTQVLTWDFRILYQQCTIPALLLTLALNIVLKNNGQCIYFLLFREDKKLLFSVQLMESYMNLNNQVIESGWVIAIHLTLCDNPTTNLQRVTPLMDIFTWSSFFRFTKGHVTQPLDQSKQIWSEVNWFAYTRGVRRRCIQNVFIFF